LTKKKKSWVEKLGDSKGLPRVEKTTEKMSKRWGTGARATGIFAWIAANAAEEQRQEGKHDITPYWRTLKTGGVINPKYPGGVERQKRLLEKEGHKVVQKGKKYVVVDYEKSLEKL